LPDAGSAHLCFTSDNLDADVARLQAAGVVFRSLPVETTSGPNRGGRGVYVEDPDGNAVEIVQVAAREAP
jgi:catechol 2,3-dioxygenase-like lactoylglutathione lyase family enzyme